MKATRPDRMPVLVLSGFLGAGKTTFLNQLLANPQLQDSLVIVNEFGDAGLDSLFLETDVSNSESGLLVEELTSGCLCCTLQGPLVQTLEDLLRARDNGRIAPFKQLIIETTGLADPTPILGAFAKHPYLSLRFLVGGIVTVADAAQDVSLWDDTPEAKAQIAVADVLAISKTDLVEPEIAESAVKALAERNPQAVLKTTTDLVTDPEWLETLLSQALPVQPQPETHDHHHGHEHNQGHSHDHDHDHHHHAYSVVVETGDALQQKTIAMFMDLLGMNFPGDLLRVKGIAWIAPDGGGDLEPWAVHAAGPLQHPARPIVGSVRDKLTSQQSQIVVITRTDQSEKIKGLFDACLKQNRV